MYKDYQQQITKELNANRYDEQKQQQQAAAAPGLSQGGMCGSPRPFTLAAEAETRMREHAEAHDKHSAAYQFLTLHPEFDEFVRLVRSGSIQF